MAKKKDTTKRTKIEPKDYQLPVPTDAAPPVHVKPKPHIYTDKEMKFIDKYVETLDRHTALKYSGMTLTQLKKNKYVMNELMKLQNIAQKKHRLKMAGANHMGLMEKFEDLFDEAVESKDYKTAVGMSSTLARSSEAAMRASGEFKDERQEQGLNIQVNINMGEEKPKTIEGEATTINIDTGDN